MLRSTLITLLTLCCVTGTLAATVAEDFATANGYFEEKEYVKAIELYEGILDGGEESAALYFNLANAHYKNGDLGHAILNYMRARRLDPGDEDIVSNLEFAKQFTGLQMEGVELNPINRFFVSIVDPYHITTLAWISSGLFVLFIVLLILRFGLGMIGGMIRTGLIVSLVMLIAASMVTTFKYRHDYLTRRAVLTAFECPVRSGPSENLDIELEGAPGLVVEILSESGDYYNVLFENNRRGWIRKDLVAEI